MTESGRLSDWQYDGIISEAEAAETESEKAAL
jgi:hypothetical protein